MKRNIQQIYEEIDKCYYLRHYNGIIKLIEEHKIKDPIFLLKVSFRLHYKGNLEACMHRRENLSAIAMFNKLMEKYGGDTGRSSTESIKLLAKY